MEGPDSNDLLKVKINCNDKLLQILHSRFQNNYFYVSFDISEIQTVKRNFLV